MINDFLSKSFFGTSPGAKFGSSTYTHKGSGEIDNNLYTRWFMEDGTSTSVSQVKQFLVDVVSSISQKRTSTSIINHNRLKLKVFVSPKI